MKVKNTIKKKFFNADGTINKTVVASFITLLIVLIQQVMLAFGFKYGHWDQVAAIINTVLTILGLCGFVEGNGEVTTSIVHVTPSGVDATISSSNGKSGITTKDFPAGSSIVLNNDKVTFGKGSFIPNRTSEEDKLNGK